MYGLLNSVPVDKVIGDQNAYTFTKIVTAEDEFGSVQGAIFVGRRREKKQPKKVMNVRILHSYGNILNLPEAPEMDNHEKVVNNESIKVTLKSQGYTEHILDLDLFDDVDDVIEFHLDHDSDNTIKIKANLKLNGYKPHEIDWDAEEVL